MSARDEVLARIRLARPSAPVDVPRDYDRDEDGPSPVDLFVERVADYKATVRRCAPDGIAGTVAALLDGVPGIVVPTGVPGDWLAAYPGRIVPDDGLTVADLDAPGLAVVTGCAVGIATTGTLVLDAGPDQGRRALTLVPDHHVCVIRTDQIVRGVPAALARIAVPTRPLTFVSGPSATSDIELNRVEGVHGPRRLDVVVCG
jgi:L-lactate dehydrogenase complex protein LldG